jgi:hypothetical protein
MTGQGSTALEIVNRPLPFLPSMPTFASSLTNDGDDGGRLRNVNAALGKPNEDAVAMPEGWRR